MGSGASAQQSQPDHLGLMFANKKETKTQATQTTSESTAIATQTEALSTSPTEPVSARAVAVQETPPKTKAKEKEDDDDDLDNISLSSQASIASIFKVPVNDGLERLRENMKKLHARQDFLNDDGITELLFLVNCTPNLDTTGKRDKRAKRYVEEMVKLGVVDVVAKVTRKYFSEAMGAKASEELPYLCLTLCFSFTMNAASLSLSLCQEIRRTELYKDMFKILDHSYLRPENNYHYLSVSGKYKQAGDFVTLVLIALQICIQRLDMRELYRDCEAVRIFDMYRKARHHVFKSMAELAFASVVMEAEKDLMILDNASLELLKGTLEQAIQKKGQSDGGSFGSVFQVDKIMDALNHLAVNDKNKAKFAEKGFIPFYVTHLDEEKCSENELIVATKGLYLMAFRAQQKMKQTPGCVEKLTHLAQKSDVKQVRDQAKGALWIIEGKSDDRPGAEEQSQTPAATQDAKSKVSGGITMEGGHVFMSYQWINKEILLRVREQMTQAGYRVWMDTESMNGADLDEMSEAIEKSSAVLICLSEKYKESPSCRLECEYASKRGKPIIPLLLQYRYDPDGWLGIIKGTKLHFDFAQDHKFADSLQGLMREIGRLGENVNKPPPKAKEEVFSPKHVPQSRKTLEELEIEALLNAPDSDPEDDTISLSSNASITSVFKLSLDDGLQRVRTAIQALKVREDYASEAGVVELLFLLNCTPNLDTTGKRDKRARKYVDEMVKLGVMDIALKVVRKYYDESLTAKAIEDLPYLCVTLIYSFIMNGMSLSKKLCAEFARKDMCGEMFRMLDSEVARPESNNMYRDTTGKYEIWGNPVTIILISLQIAIQRFDLRQKYRNYDAVRIFDMYRKSENDVFKSMAELGFALVVMETEKDMMVVDDEACTTFQDILQQASENKDKTDGGSFDMVFQVDRILEALNALAINDENKVKIAEHGLLPHYVKCLDTATSSEREQTVATKGLYLLAFKVKERLKTEPGCVDGLKKLSETSPYKEAADQAKGALWIIEGKDEVDVHHAGQPVSHAGVVEEDDMKEGHVMISYQWGTKPTMIRVRDRMKEAGINVWMDIDNMSGSLLDSMAEAVEKSSCVLVCLTQKYKESPSCRLECEYAAKRRKKMIPLLLETGYDPDGWLGIIIGAQNALDFCSDTTFDPSVKRLNDKILNLGDKTRPQTAAVRSLVTWTEEQIATWLTNCGLKHCIAKLKALNGESLQEYRHLMDGDPQFFNKSLETEYKLSVKDIMTFRKALRRI